MRTKRHLFPLRKVISHTSVGGNRDVLECGHMLPEASDIYGPRFPSKRRCGDCWRAFPESERQRLIKESEARKAKRKDRELKAWLKYSASLVK